MSITCPICGLTSHNRNDEHFGWCAQCFAFTHGHLARLWLFNVDHDDFEPYGSCHRSPDELREQHTKNGEMMMVYRYPTGSLVWIAGGEMSAWPSDTPRAVGGRVYRPEEFQPGGRLAKWRRGHGDDA